MLITTGRVSGEPREVEIWFAREEDTVFILSGDGVHSHWVRNILAEPAVSVRIGDETFEGRGQVVDGEEEIAPVRELGARKYDRLDSSGRPDGASVAIELAGGGGS